MTDPRIARLVSCWLGLLLIIHGIRTGQTPTLVMGAAMLGLPTFMAGQQPAQVEIHTEPEVDPDLLSLLTTEDWTWLRDVALAPAGLRMLAG